MSAYRLYLVNLITLKKTGKKRDYPSLEHFKKYGLETYERYNRSEYYTGVPTNLKAELCVFGDDQKWNKLSEDEVSHIVNTK